jgi:hypothetical protein
MKKILLLLIGIFTLYSCETPEEVSVKDTNEQMSKIGDVTKTPDLYIPESESGWAGYGIRPDGTYGTFDKTLGLRIPRFLAANYPSLTQDCNPVIVNQNGGLPLLEYSCYIANGAPIDYSGQNDFAVNMEEDGIILETNGDYNFPGMLSIVTYQNGLPVAETIKQTFWLSPNQTKLGYDDLLGTNFIYPFMGLPAGTGDLYYNKAQVKPGLNLIVVEINPDLEINESNYNNNVSTLPVNVTMGSNSYFNYWIGSATVDTEAILDNRTRTPNNIVVTKKFTGRDKFVKLDWDCPYHAPIYVKHYFTIKKNGVVIANNVLDSDYTEVVSGNYRTSTYEITTKVVGLRESFAATVVVNK